jgi:hypothetical protein
LEHEPEELLNAASATIDRFLCQALRGEPAPWSALEPLVPDAEFVERSRHHGVQALLFCLMKSRPEWHDWPVVVRGALEQSHKALVAQDLMRQHYLATLVGALADRGVRCLLTKGEALARTLYATPGTRSRSDSDLFIPVAAIEDVRRSVVGLGYRIVSPVYKSRQFTVMRPGSTSGDVRFDIHWRILNAPRYARVLSFEEAHGRSAVVPGLQNARMLCHQDALLLACMHRFGNARHDRNRLIWIYDIDALVRAMGDSALLRFASIAVDKDVQAECLDGLLRAAECFGTVLPDWVRARIESPRPQVSWTRRFSRSQPGLLIADWRELQSGKARSGLVNELFIPSAGSLLARYNKNSRLWLPVLYTRRLLGGLFGRLTLR